MALKHRSLDPQSGVEALEKMYVQIMEAEEAITIAEDRQARMAGRRASTPIEGRFPALQAGPDGAGGR